jgi:hypothetical protein
LKWEFRYQKTKEFPWHSSVQRTISFFSPNGLGLGNGSRCPPKTTITCGQTGKKRYPGPSYAMLSLWLNLGHLIH